MEIKKEINYFRPAAEKYETSILTHSDIGILDHELIHCQTRSNRYAQANAIELVLTYEIVTIQTPQFYFRDHSTDV